MFINLQIVGKAFYQMKYINVAAVVVGNFLSWFNKYKW